VMWSTKNIFIKSRCREGKEIESLKGWGYLHLSIPLSEGHPVKTGRGNRGLVKPLKVSPQTLRSKKGRRIGRKGVGEIERREKYGQVK